MVALRANLLLFVAAVLASAFALGAGFVFDDHSLPGTQVDWLSLTQTRPLTYATFALDSWFYGGNAGGFHLTNLLLHGVCCMLLLRVLTRLIGFQAALIAALLFAVHPLQSEAVNYIFARGSILATLFVLLSVECWIRGRLAAAVLLFAAAMLAKEECAAFAVLMLLYCAFWRRPRREWYAAAAMFGAALLLGLRVLYATHEIAGSGSGFASGIGPLEYFRLQGYVILHYARLFLVPWGFSIDPPTPTGSYLGWLAIGAAASLAAWRRQYWLLAAFVLLLPSSSILPAADAIAYRRVYLPMTALCTGAGMLLASRPRAVTASIVAVLAVLSLQRSYVWSSERRLWAEAVGGAPGKVRPKLQLAQISEPAVAWPLLREAERLEPSNPRVPEQMGRLYLLAGKPANALGAFGKALALNPGDANAVMNRGVALAALGQRDAAAADFTRALQMNSHLDAARRNLQLLGQ